MDVNWQTLFTVAASIAVPLVAFLSAYLVYKNGKLTRERDDLNERERRRVEREQREGETELGYIDRLQTRIGVLEGDNDRLRHEATASVTARFTQEHELRMYWQRRAAGIVPILKESNDLTEEASTVFHELLVPIPHDDDNDALMTGTPPVTT